MAVRLGINIASLQAQRRLGEHTNELSRVSERLSSGQRINRASDDAAGLSVSSILQSNSRIYSASIRNINDGISAINIADGALASLSDIATRIAELSEQAANGVYSSKQRVALDNEAQALASEFGRIAEVTSFNGIKLLNGSVDSLDLQVGIDSGVNSRLSVNMPSASSRLVGDGTFTADSIFATGPNLRGLAVGDLNGDGLNDIVTGSYDNARVNIHLSNGDGTYSLRATYNMAGGVGRPPQLGDLNSDGNLDVIVRTGNDFSVRLGDGTGGFGAQAIYLTYNSVVSYELADFNEDNILDVAVHGGGSLNIHIGNGNGTFVAPVSYTIGAGNGDMAIGDLNGDSHLDIVVGSTGETSPLGVMFGDGNGSFTPRVSYDPGNVYRTPRLADFNGDGHLDVVASSGTGLISVSFGSQDGTLTLGPNYTVSNGAASPIPGDFNGDGVLDIAYTDSTNSLIGILIGNSNGTFNAPSTMPYTNPRAIALADMNGDNVLDLVVPGVNDFGVFYGNGRPAGGLDPFSLLTQNDARAALDYFNDKIKDLAQDRGTLGVGLSRLNVALNNNTTARENTDAAASRIIDADIAQDASELIRLQILQSTASKILSQANLQPRLVLDLLN